MRVEKRFDSFCLIIGIEEIKPIPNYLVRMKRNQRVLSFLGRKVLITTRLYPHHEVIIEAAAPHPSWSYEEAVRIGEEIERVARAILDLPE